MLTGPESGHHSAACIIGGIPLGTAAGFVPLYFMGSLLSLDDANQPRRRVDCGSGGAGVFYRGSCHWRDPVLTVDRIGGGDSTVAHSDCRLAGKGALIGWRVRRQNAL